MSLESVNFNTLCLFTDNSLAIEDTYGAYGSNHLDSEVQTNVVRKPPLVCSDL